MASSWLKKTLKKKLLQSHHKHKPDRFVPNLEPLSDRILLSIGTVFDPAAGVLSIFGDNQDNRIVVSRDAAGNILVNSGAVGIKGGAPTVANTRLIRVFGRAGNDQIALDESNGALPSANLFGALAMTY